MAFHLSGIWQSRARVAAAESWKTAGWFLPWQHLIQFIAPDFFRQSGDVKLLGCMELRGIYRLHRCHTVVICNQCRGAGAPGFFAVATAVSLIFMLPSPFSKLPFELHIPIVSVLQPTRLMVFVDFSLAVLVSFGIDQLRKGNTKRLYKSIIFYGIGLVVLWVVASGVRFVSQNGTLLENFAVARRNLVIPTALFAGMILWLVFFGRQNLRWRQALGSRTYWHGRV